MLPDRSGEEISQLDGWLHRHDGLLRQITVNNDAEKLESEGSTGFFYMNASEVPHSDANPTTAVTSPLR